MNTSARTCILEIENLSFAYPDQPALASGWSTSLGTGLTLLYGDTGSGKSTLLRLLAGTLPVSGRLKLVGSDLADEPETYGRQVFFVDPATDVFDQVTARACLASLAAANPPIDEASLHALIEGFALAPHLDKPMYMLSTGSKRKVWLAAALVSRRPLILLDEPTGGLDAASLRCLWRAVAELAKRADCAIVLASTERIDRVPLAACIELPLG